MKKILLIHINRHQVYENMPTDKILTIDLSALTPENVSQLVQLEDEILKDLEKEIPQLIIGSNQQNFGKGRALKKAFKYASGDLIVWLDADLDLHPYQIKILYDIMVLNDADIVIGSKMHPNSKVNYPLTRKIISLGYYCIIRILFNLPCHDTQTGLTLFKRKVMEEVFLRISVKQFAFDLEVLVNAHHLGFKLVEAPIILENKRDYGRIGVK